MDFNYPPGFSQLPTELQDEIRRGMIQQMIFNVHLSGEYIKAINEIINITMRFVSMDKYKEDPDVKKLDQDISSVVNRVKEEMEKYNSE